MERRNYSEVIEYCAKDSELTFLVWQVARAKGSLQAVAKMLRPTNMILVLSESLGKKIDIASNRISHYDRETSRING